MTKLIIICGGDRLGKTSIIKSLLEYYDYKNITLRHCDKPPKNLANKQKLEFQFKCFNAEADLYHNIKDMDEKYCYHDNIIIYDRFHLGEYVYGSMFRNTNIDLLKNLLEYYEKFSLECLNDNNIFLISLTADPEFFFSKEDGQSFSQTLEEKTKELKLFKEAHELSLIKNKKMIKVDNNGQFRKKDEILKEVLEFIK